MPAKTTSVRKEWKWFLFYLGNFIYFCRIIEWFVWISNNSKKYQTIYRNKIKRYYDCILFNESYLQNIIFSFTSLLSVIKVWFSFIYYNFLQNPFSLLWIFLLCFSIKIELSYWLFPLCFYNEKKASIFLYKEE